jgi:hypothetical protein
MHRILRVRTCNALKIQAYLCSVAIGYVCLFCVKCFDIHCLLYKQMQ